MNKIRIKTELKDWLIDNIRIITRSKLDFD